MFCKAGNVAAIIVKDIVPGEGQNMPPEPCPGQLYIPFLPVLRSYAGCNRKPWILTPLKHPSHPWPLGLISPLPEAAGWLHTVPSHTVGEILVGDLKAALRGKCKATKASL